MTGQEFISLADRLMEHMSRSNGDDVVLYVPEENVLKLRRAVRVGKMRRRRRASEYCC